MPVESMNVTPDMSSTIGPPCTTAGAMAISRMGFVAMSSSPLSIKSPGAAVTENLEAYMGTSLTRVERVASPGLRRHSRRLGL